MIERLFQELSALPQVEAIALGGSRAGESYDAASDYDVYVYVTAPVPEEVRRTLLAPSAPSRRSATGSGRRRTTAFS